MLFSVNPPYFLMCVINCINFSSNTSTTASSPETVNTFPRAIIFKSEKCFLISFSLELLIPKSSRGLMSSIPILRSCNIVFFILIRSQNYCIFCCLKQNEQEEKEKFSKLLFGFVYRSLFLEEYWFTPPTKVKSWWNNCTHKLSRTERPKEAPVVL